MSTDAGWASAVRGFSSLLTEGCTAASFAGTSADFLATTRSCIGTSEVEISSFIPTRT